MKEKIQFWHHFFLVAGLSILLIFYPLKIAFIPWITFQVIICKKSTIAKALWFHFALGLFYTLHGSSMKMGVYSLILCLNYLTLAPLKRAFIDDQLFASSLFAALFGVCFSLSEFIFYQIFLSDIPFELRSISVHFGLKFLSDFSLSFLIFSWLYLVNFSIVKIKEIYQRFQLKKQEKRRHVN
jgi:hypothetical protein